MERMNGQLYSCNHVPITIIPRVEASQVVLKVKLKFNIFTANIKKLGKESKDELGLGCVNGIKAVSMFCIISGHALVFMVSDNLTN